MTRSRRWLVAAGIMSVALGGVLTPAAPAAASQRDDVRRLPKHLFTPYFEAYTPDSPGQLSHQSGARYLTMAFLQTPSRGSCTITWNGTAPVAWSTYGADIARIRAAGGDVIPSFGGYSADHSGTEIADSCTSVPAIAAAYEKVVTTYGVTRLDLDTEDRSLNRTAAIDRRNQAIALVEDWAKHEHRLVQFVYTLPTNTSGLDPSGVRVLRDAAARHARIDIVNIMTFDYYDNQPHEMARDTMTATGHLYGTLHTLFPEKPPHALWAMVGVTEMIGIDDFGPPEIFTLADAHTVREWAQDRGIAELSFWALECDNGGCPGTAGSDSCSGITQSRWQFTHILAPFTNNRDRG